MITTSDLDTMRQLNMSHVDKSMLMDIRALQADLAAPLMERLAKYLEHTRNPYAFRVGEIGVKLVFSPDGKTLDEKIARCLLSQKRNDCGP